MKSFRNERGERTRHHLRDERGQTVIYVAFFLGLLALGFVAFALDVGVLFRAKRMAQSAAEAAAVAAAEEVGSNNAANEQAMANAMAKLNGFDTTLAVNPATVTLTTPATGNFTGSYVQATVSMPIHTYFLGAFSHGMTTVPVSSTAIAGGGISSQTCVCVTGNFSITGGSTLNAPGCGVFDNSSSSSSIRMSGGSTLNASSLGGASTGWYPNNITGSGDTINVPTADIVQGVSTSCTPTLPAAPSFNPANCLANPGGSYGTYTFGPANANSTICYKALTVGANGSTCTLNPGIYVINNGELHFTGNPNYGGNGVFFYLTGTASLVLDGGVNVNLVSGGATESGGGPAPVVGTYDGVLIFQDPNDTSAITFTGGSQSYMNGAIIAPSAAITISGGSGSTVMEGGINASSLSLTGGATVKAILDTNEGSLSLYSSNPKLVQ
ncbi:MAG: pilus assembly protein TadG-related protein [Acidobacteriaceae bacterium]